MKKLGGRVPEDLEARLSSIARELSGDPNVVAFYLFGSRARGEHDTLSDVDVALLLREVGESAEEPYLARVCEVLGTDEVSLLVLNRAPVALAESALRDAKVLTSNDEARRLDFEQRVQLRYLDFKPYLERYDRELFQDIAARGER